MNDVILYTTRTCPYCVAAKSLLQRKGVLATEVDVQLDPERFREMLERSGGRRSVPQIFIGSRHVGGFDDLAALERQGQLDPLLGRD
ncbi:glutaredoxin 3 [Metapseudomonas resinovorans]|uniref:glutaredoxin 3 n=1 Tax=Metapseudomonas resinovorans TaxID=53412 RepID=UPI00237F48C4|nr:glutaredoxin 3 [Pseudomonas resinovorans]MDE3735791.1 glutaredoxin 3 [Pseudomonas resinovorans]